MIHVGLNLLFVLPGNTGGIEIYARELIKAMADEAEGIRFTAFINNQAFPKKDELLPPGMLFEVLKVRPRTRIGWVRGEQTLLPRRVAARGCDILHSLASTAPLTGGFRRVTTIHDLVYRLLPQIHRGSAFLGARWLVSRFLIPLAARRSDRIVTVSYAACRDIQRELNLPDAKLRMIHSGPGATSRVVAEPEETMRRRLDLGDRRLILSVSSKWPHKNLANLVRAMALLPEGDRPLLVVPGYPTPYGASLHDLVQSLELQHDVRFTDWVPNETLETLYGSVACCVLPSWYEGFGFPALEAMKRGIPLICSHCEAHKEIVGEGGSFFDPARPDEIAGAIRQTLTDASWAEKLGQYGRGRAAAFDWSGTARATLDVYREVYARGAGSSNMPVA